MTANNEWRRAKVGVCECGDVGIYEEPYKGPGMVCPDRWCDRRLKPRLAWIHDSCGFAHWGPENRKIPADHVCGFN